MALRVGIGRVGIDTVGIQGPAVVTVVVHVPQRRRRVNSTNRRRLVAFLVDAIGVAPASDDRALGAAFVTRRIASRRALSIGWIAALAPQPQAPAGQPVSAWFAPVVRKRRATERTLRTVDDLHWPYIAPTMAAILPVPKAVKPVEFRRKLQAQAPQIVYPPTTGPPAAPFPSWVARDVRAVSQRRRLQRLPEQPVYPATPAAPVVIAALFANRPKRRKRRQGLFLSGGGVVEARVQAQYPAYEPAVQLKRKSTRRTLQWAPSNPAWPATPAVAPPVTAWTRAASLWRLRHERTYLDVPPHAVYPPTPVAARMPAHVPVGFHRRLETERRPLRVPELDQYPASPAVGAQPESAWRPPTQHRIERARTLQGAAPQVTYPATPPPPESAWRAVAAKRVEHKRKLLPAAAQITYPRTLVSDVATRPVLALERRSTKRTLRRAEHAPQYRQTPVPEQPPTAFRLAEAFRRHGWRVLRTVPELDDHPASPNRSEPKPERTARVGKPNRTEIVRRASRTYRTQAAGRTEKP